MKNFDWFTVLGMLAIAENTIFMIAQGDWWIAVGLMFGGFWAWIAYWDWKHKHLAKVMDAASRSQTTDIHTISEVALRREIADAYIQSRRYGVTDKPQFIGDVSCKWNARSPHLRCAINPSGECQWCKDYEGV
ncbi:DUF6464 family protein [Nostoc sp.]|uniref:DUF6464 family protein n=1 Tax=Nostoc sp. TaxID=1180 RepID=UPI002FF7F81A